MKTKTFLLQCLFIGLPLTKLTAQLPVPPEGTKSIVSTFEVPFWGGVSCDGVILIDVLLGTITMKETDLYKNGVLIKGNASAHGELVSQKNGEIFKINESAKAGGAVDDYGFFLNMEWHCNFIGDKGSIYIGNFSLVNGMFQINKIVCPGNKLE